MKVLMVVPNLLIGGLETMVFNLCVELRQMPDMEVRLFAYDWTEQGLNLRAKFDKEAIPYEVFAKGPGFSLKAVRALRGTVLEFQPDVIHSHDLGALLYSRLATMALRHKPRHVHTQHTLQHLHGHWKQDLYDRALVLGLNHFVGVSTDVIDTYRTRGLKENKMSLVENGVSFPSEQAQPESNRLALRRSLLEEIKDDHERNKLAQDLNDRWLVCVGRVDEHKGQLDLIKIWNETSESFRSERRLVIVGPEAQAGERARLQAAMQSALSPERIVYAGPSLRARDWLQASDAFLSASHHEGMPLAPIEALGSGLPVLLSHIPGHTFLKSYPGVEFFDALDVKAAALVWMKAEERPLSQSELWPKAKDLRLRHGVATMASRYADLYRRLGPRPMEVA